VTLLLTQSTLKTTAVTATYLKEHSSSSSIVSR
jgi:hypothetical protein